MRKKAVILSVLAIIASMMIATILEKIYGSQLSVSLVYHNPLFIALWAVAAVSGLLLALESKMQKRLSVLSIHVSFLLILAGALITFLTSKSGTLHLRQSESCSFFADTDMMRADLPFTVTLDEFQVEYYPQTDIPKDYNSYVTISSGAHSIRARIYMNHPLRYHGYRFCQSSYDPDLRGTILAVSYDPWGVPISYTGYFLLMASMLGFFFNRKSGFREALDRLGKRAALIALFTVGTGSQANASVKQVVTDSITGSRELLMVPSMTLVTLGILLFILTGVLLAREISVPIWLKNTEKGVAVTVFIYLTVLLGLRWYAQGHIPMASGFEMMLLIAWCAMLGAWIMVQKLPVLGPMTFILAGFAILVAVLGEPKTEISPLKPVLSSPLLAIHVTCMMISYTMFGLAALNGIMGLAMKNNAASSKLADITLVILYPAVFLLTAGTVLGAIWANISWGSYWMWDPKETWALITIMVYAFSLHGASVPRFRKPSFMHLFSIVAFLCVLITYFGVNLVLGGMHSYS